MGSDPINGSVTWAGRWRRRTATTGRSCRHRSRATCVVALVVDAPRGRGTGALLTLSRRAFLVRAAVRRATGVRVLAAVRIRADGLFALLHDRVVVRAAVRCHLAVRLLHRLTAIALQLDHATLLRALDDASAA